MLYAALLSKHLLNKKSKSFLLAACALSFLYGGAASAAEQSLASSDSGASVEAGQKVSTAGPQAIDSADDLQQWMTYYYLHPQPNLLVPAFLFADKSSMLDGGGRAPFIAFVSRVFATQPGQISGWVNQLSELSPKNKQALWTALWWSRTKEGKDALDGILATLPDKVREALQQQMATPPEPIEKMEVNDQAIVDELWACYCATGDQRYVQRVLSLLPWTDSSTQDYNKLTIGAFAKWSLAGNLVQHPGLLKICKATSESQPELKKFIDPVINPNAVAAGKQKAR